MPHGIRAGELPALLEAASRGQTVTIETRSEVEALRLKATINRMKRGSDPPLILRRKGATLTLELRSIPDLKITVT